VLSKDNDLEPDNSPVIHNKNHLYFNDPFFTYELNIYIPGDFVITGLWLDFLCSKELKKFANTPSPGVDVLVALTGSIFNKTIKLSLNKFKYIYN
jgi:hypothetical protein